MSSNLDHLSHAILDHPSIGQITGIRRLNGVTQFLGIQYATLKDGYGRGELTAPSPGGVLDATKHGPVVPNPPDCCEREHALIQKSLPCPKLQQSDTECLTLNITVPGEPSQEHQRPVLVFVYGGGFANGSANYPHYDMALITEMSVGAGMPIISVGVNYRVGLPGFLHSPELEAAGYKANNGLDDQRLAFRWIRRNIGGFGGDPTRVTFMGESAGAFSGCVHLHSDEPLFQQYISMSGTTLLRPRRIERVHGAFNGLASKLEVGNREPGLQVRRIVETAKDPNMAHLGRKFGLGPVVDGDLLPAVTTHAALADQQESLRLFPGMRHCKRILIGDCQMDGMAWASRLAASERSDIFPKTLEQCLARTLDPLDTALTPAIVSAYGLDTSANSNTEKTTEPVLNFGNDITFAVPVVAFAQAWSASAGPDTKAFVYHFDCPNPWEGPWKGHASHALDIAFALQNYREFLSPGQRLCAERFARDIIRFVNGFGPWDGWVESAKSGSMVYFAAAEGNEDESKFIPDGNPKYTGRRSILQKLAKGEVLDKVMDAWQMFMAGPR